MTRIKICGFTRASDLELAARLGVDAVGLVFTPGPRQVKMGRARELVARARQANSRSPEVWGVFAREPVEMVNQYVEFLGLDVVQLHGAFYRAEDVEAVKEAPVVRGINFSGTPEDLEEIRRSLDAGCRAVLLDAPATRGVGGTGHTTDWLAAAEAAARFPVILSGGLSHRNVAEAIRKVRPMMVDASSGLELAPGIKDPALIERFVAAVATAS